MESFTVKANILVPPFHMYYFNLDIEGWIVTPTSGGTEYTKTFTNSSKKDWIEAVTNLKNILLSCFLDDFSPRIIKSFETDIINKLTSEHDDMFKRFQLLSIFGENRGGIAQEDQAREAFYFSGELFNGACKNHLHYQPDIKQIRDWFYLLRMHPYLATNLNLIQQSFGLINKFFNSFNYFDPSDLLTGIILLVSGLEGIFLKNQNDVADLVFKFSTIGSIYYDCYAKENILDKFGKGSKKFSITDFRRVLKTLYSLRSQIAHGDYQKLIDNKAWRQLLVLLNVEYRDQNDIQITLKQSALALCILQKHLLSMFVGAKENLLKGVNIIEEVTFEYNNPQE